MPNPLIVPPRTKTVFLYPGGAEEELDDLRDKLDAAMVADNPATRRMNSRSNADKIAAEFDAKAAAAAESAVRVVLAEVPARTYRQMQDENPPRKGNKRDDNLGFNEEAFLRALVRAAITSPEVTDEQFEEFADAVSEFHWRKLTTTAWEMANQELALPKPFAVSLLRRMREAGSKQQPDTE